MIWKKEPIKVQILSLSTTHMKIIQIPYVIFQATSRFPLNFASPLNVMTHSSYEVF